MDCLFDVLSPIWAAVKEVSPSPQSIEKRLIGHLGLKSVVSSDCYELCEKERAALQREVEEAHSRLRALQESLRKKPQSPEVCGS